MRETVRKNTVPGVIDSGEPVAWTEERLREEAKRRGWYVREHASVPDVINGGWKHPFSVTVSSRELLELLAPPPAGPAPVVLQEVVEPDPEYIRDYLAGVVGVVEANRFETHCLLENWHQNRGKSWHQNLSGLMPVVGHFGGMPVTLSLFTNVVDGHKLLFIDASSQVVDYRIIEEWLKIALPKSAFRDDGEFINKVDAANFHNVFPPAALPHGC